MDFGSVGPAVVSLRGRRDALMLADRAAEHCTMSYRAPELFEVPLSSSSSSSSSGGGEVDCRLADAWSLGCLLFALLYGYSPFEMEFDSRTGDPVVVACGYLRVIGRLPAPPAEPPGMRPRHANAHPSLRGLAVSLLVVDPADRPSVAGVLAALAALDLEIRPGPGGHGGGAVAPSWSLGVPAARRSAKERREASVGGKSASGGGGGARVVSPAAPSLVNVEVCEGGDWADFSQFGGAAETSTLTGREG